MFIVTSFLGNIRCSRAPTRSAWGGGGRGATKEALSWATKHMQLCQIVGVVKVRYLLVGNSAVRAVACMFTAAHIGQEILTLRSFQRKVTRSMSIVANPPSFPQVLLVNYCVYMAPSGSTTKCVSAICAVSSMEVSHSLGLSGRCLS